MGNEIEYSHSMIIRDYRDKTYSLEDVYELLQKFFHATRGEVYLEVDRGPTMSDAVLGIVVVSKGPKDA